MELDDEKLKLIFNKIINNFQTIINTCLNLLLIK